MKKFCKLFGIIAIVMVIGFSMIACDDGSGSGGNNGIDITIGDLPEFPLGSTPAGTKTDAETILAELTRSPVLDYIQEEVEEVIYENSPGGIGIRTYSFSNRSLPNGCVKVSVSATGNETNTGGFQTLLAKQKARNALYEAQWELDYNDPAREQIRDEIERLEAEIATIQFAIGNRRSGTYNENQKWELTTAKTEDGVTIARGSTCETKITESANLTVTTAGTYETFRYSGTLSEKRQDTMVLTVTTSSGSVKIIFDWTVEYSENGDDTAGTLTETEKCSGSLKVYGSNNALLIDHPIVDWESLVMAVFMISYDPHASSFIPANATPLTSNTKANGTISEPGSVALYSINVTSGAEYHLWWSGDYNWGGSDLRVKGYSGNGIPFFNTDDAWDDGVSHYAFTATSIGTVYIMVYRRDDYSTGTFTIAYNTTGNRPAMSVSFTAPLGANSRSVQNKTDSVVTPKKATGVLWHNRSVRD